MTPAEFNLEIYKGSTYRKSLQWIDKATGLPMDLTSCTFKMQIRDYLGSDNVLDELTTANSKIVLVDAAQGKWRIDLTPTQTGAYTFKKAVYDIDVTFPSTDKFTPVKGVVTLTEQVTA